MRGAQRVQKSYQRRQRRELQHQNQQPGQDLESQALASKRMPEDKYTALISVSRTKTQEEIIALVRRLHLTMVWQTVRQILTHLISHSWAMVTFRHRKWAYHTKRNTTSNTTSKGPCAAGFCVCSRCQAHKTNLENLWFCQHSKLFTCRSKVLGHNLVITRAWYPQTHGVIFK